MENNNKSKKFTTKYIKDNAQINIYFNPEATNADEIITALNEYDKLKEDNAMLLSVLKEWLGFNTLTTANNRVTLFDAKNKAEKAIMEKAQKVIQKIETE